MIPCDYRESNASTWEYRNQQLVQNPLGLCATVLAAENGTLVLGLKTCNLEDKAQQWVFREVTMYTTKQPIDSLSSLNMTT